MIIPSPYCTPKLKFGSEATVWILFHYNSEYYSEYREVIAVSLIRDRLEKKKQELIDQYQEKRKEITAANAESERKLSEYRERVRSFLLRNIECVRGAHLVPLWPEIDLGGWNQALVDKYAENALDIFYKPDKDKYLKQLLSFDKLKEEIPKIDPDALKYQSPSDLDEFSEANLVIEEVEEI